MSRFTRDYQEAQRSVFVISKETDWTDVLISDPRVPANGSLRVVSVGSYVIGGLSTGANRRFNIVPNGTSVAFRMKYGALGRLSQDPQIQVLGVDTNNSFHWLSNGDASDLATISAVGSSDVRDASNRYTGVNKYTIFDLQGSKAFLVFTKRAAVGSSRAKSGIKFQYKIV